MVDAGSVGLGTAPLGAWKDWRYQEIGCSKGEQIRCGGEEKVMNSLWTFR